MTLPDRVRQVKSSLLEFIGFEDQYRIVVRQVGTTVVSAWCASSIHRNPSVDRESYLQCVFLHAR